MTSVLTAGESGGVKLTGYDIGNSPVELEAVCKNSQYKTLLIKTTNLVPLLLTFPHAVICSSLNLNAAAKYLENKKACIIRPEVVTGVLKTLVLPLPWVIK